MRIHCGQQQDGRSISSRCSANVSAPVWDAPCSSSPPFPAFRCCGTEAANSRINNERINSHQANALHGLFMHGTDVLLRPRHADCRLFIILLKIQSYIFSRISFECRFVLVQQLLHSYYPLMLYWHYFFKTVSSEKSRVWPASSRRSTVDSLKSESSGVKGQILDPPPATKPKHDEACGVLNKINK